MILKGVNLGSWLLMEGYILGGRNIPEQEFKTKFKKIYGKKELESFERKFRNSFIAESDLRLISSWGANCIRLPLHYKIFENKPYQYNDGSLKFIRKVLRWADNYNLKVILDLHAACGCQNCDWHADSKGKALLWENEKFRMRTYALWEYLAANLKDEKALYGYDILNEPVIDRKRVGIVKAFYRHLIKSIRRIDTKKVIFLEGNIWGQEIDFLKDLLSDNIAVSIHTYLPLNFTFNFRRNYKYPGLIDNVYWDKNAVSRYLDRYRRFSSKNKVDIYVGEFGVNYRGNKYGELVWLDDILSMFEKFGFSWTYWTYKAVSNAVFPDGIVQYIHNPCWVKREGPVYGLENLYTEWAGHKREIIRSWNTKNFWVNSDIVTILKNYFIKTKKRSIIDKKAT